MKKGFTLFELAVLILIIGILSIFAIPKFRRTAEMSKANAALDYLSNVRLAYKKYHFKNKTYTENLSELNITFPMPEHFEIQTLATDEKSWSLTLKRKSPHSGYGNYTITFNQNGFDTQNSTIAAKINPVVQ